MIWMLIVWVLLAVAVALIVGPWLAGRPARRLDAGHREESVACAPTRCPMPGGGFDAFDRAFRDLYRQDPVAARLGVLCWIGGLTEHEAAGVLGIDPDVARDRLLAAAVCACPASAWTPGVDARRT